MFFFHISILAILNRISKRMPDNLSTSSLPLLCIIHAMGIKKLRHGRVMIVHAAAYQYADHMRFVHLNTYSTYSLLKGMASPKKLAAYAAEQGFDTLGITDYENVYGAVDISKSLPAQQVFPLLGGRLTITDDAGTVWGTVSVLVQNEAGWRSLLQLVTQANLASAADHCRAIRVTDLVAHATGLILLTGGARFGMLRPLLEAKNIAAATEVLTTLQHAFDDRLYIECQRHGLDIETNLEPHLIELAMRLNLPTVATNDSRFLKPDEAEAYNALVCIGEGLTLDSPEHTAFGPEYALRPAADMEKLFADIPEALANTTAIAQRCGFWLEEKPVKQMFMPVWPTENPADVPEILRQQAHTGLAARLQQFVLQADQSAEMQAKLRQQYEDRLTFELEMIIQMGFAGYFLITSDFIRWAKGQNIPVGPGRGSGAGSLVAWVLDITDLDPIRWELYFERFLNPDRVSLPDFDVDFCQERRDEVIQYVCQKYGSDRVAQIITFGSLKARACIRDVGRVMQLPYGLVSKICAFVPEGPNPPGIAEVIAGDERLQALAQEEDGVQELLTVAQQLEGCLRHASTHAAGVVITDRPIVDVCGLYNDPRSTLPATQFPMFDAEYAGLVKFDFLGLKTLTTIQKTLEIVQATYGVSLDILQIPLEDEATYDELCAGNTTGIFQIESAGMTDLCRRMRPRNLEDLSALVALYRPGPLGSGMVDDYIDVRHGKQAAKYPHPALEPVLADTFGVPVYQEQIMRMAQVLAGYSLAQADMLRRAMGKKKPAEMAKHRELFVAGAAQHHGVDAEQANQIFDLMAVFAGYGFNKAHSLAYAYISYQTAYLKTHYPLAFMAASMTMDKGNTDKLLVHRNELQRMGFTLRAPNINTDRVNFSIESTAPHEGAVLYALSALKGAGEDAMRQLRQAVKAAGGVEDIFTLAELVPPQVLTRKNLEVLAKAGALDVFQLPRADLLENIDTIQAYCQHYWEEKNSSQIGLFGEATGSQLQRPPLVSADKNDLWQTLQNEHSVLGFYHSAHPLSAYEFVLQRMDNLTPIAALPEAAAQGKSAAHIAGIMMAKKEVRTKKGARMGILTLSDVSGQTEVVVFPEAYTHFQDLLVQTEPLLLHISMNQENDRLRLHAEHLESLAQQPAKWAQITLKVDASADLHQVKHMLAAQPTGETICTLVLPANGHGEVKVRLPQRLSCSAVFLQDLRQLAGVQLQG